MASYTVTGAQVGAHAKTLVADTVDTVTFSEDQSDVTVYSDGTAKIYFTVDGTTPTVGGANCYFLPDTPSERHVVSRTTEATVVKLISAGTPTYHVTKAD